MKFSRRNFLKGMSGATGMLALSPITSLSVIASEGKSSGIESCSHWGPVKLEVKEGKIISSKNSIATTIHNELASVAADQVYTKARVKYPMVRKGFLENPGQPSEMRGKEEFVRVSWEEALQLIHEQHMRIRKQYGAESVYASSKGWSSTAHLHKPQALMQRYMSMAGGFVSHQGDYSTGAVQVIMPYVMGTIECYEQQTSYPLVLKHSDVVVFWGANPRVTTKVCYSASDCQGLEFLNQLKASGKTIICIDPRRSETIAFFGEQAQWIAPTPGTDVAMMLGIAHHLVKTDRHDKEFLGKYTSGYEKFEAYLLGKTDGIEKTVEWASAICDVPVKQLETLADIFINNRTLIAGGWSIQRQQYGEQKHFMMATLAAMLGQIGLPGGGFGLSYHQGNGGNPTRNSTKPGSMSIKFDPNLKDAHRWPKTGAVNLLPVAKIGEAILNPGKRYQHNGQEQVFPDLKMLWHAGGSIMTHQQNTNTFIKAWQKLEMIVINEPYWTGAARYADIVLPVTTSWERNDISITGDYSGQHLVPMKQAVEPYYESRSDFDIFADMAELLGYGGKEHYTEGKSEIQWIAQFYNQALESGKKKRIRLPKFGHFWKQNKLIEMKESKKGLEYVRYSDFRADPVKNALGTQSGKIELYSKTLERYGYEDCPPHATWIPPTEWLGSAKKGELQLITPHPSHRLHSQLNYSSLRDQYAVADREPITINTQDANARGIQSGDVVRAFNDRGQILVGAVVTDDIKVGVVAIQEGAWLDMDAKTGMCKNGAVNMLCVDKTSSQLANACTANSNLVRIEKYTGQVPPLTAFDEPEYKSRA